MCVAARRRRKSDTGCIACVCMCSRPLQITGASFFPCTYNPATHKRSYATNCYYLPNKDRPNLHVAVKAAVNRVLTEETPKGEFQAVAVEFRDADGKVHTVNARKEVVLSAG